MVKKDNSFFTKFSSDFEQSGFAQIAARWASLAYLNGFLNPDSSGPCICVRFLTTR